MADHFKSDKRYIYLTDPSCEFYIPLSYFSGGQHAFAEDHGSTIRVFAVFVCRFFDENGKLTETRIMNLPTWVDINVYQSTEDVVDLGNGTSVKCKVLKYIRGMKIMGSTVVKDSSNAEAFLSLVTKGAIPDSVPYDKAKEIWQRNLDLNDAHLGVPSVILELILSAAYRYKQDPTMKFAYAIGDGKTDNMYDYVMNSIRQICQNTSTYTALTFEDIDSMAIASINRTSKNKQEAISPVEVLLKL